MAGLRPTIINSYLSHGPAVSRAVHRLLAAVAPEHRALEFYWSAGCPYSYVMAQQLASVTGDSSPPLVVRPVPLGADDVNPAPALRASHGPRDCAALARFYDLDFPAEWKEPDHELVRRGQRAVADTPTLGRCIDVGRALWSADSVALEALPQADEGGTQDLLATNASRLRSTGHYQPGTVRYRGEWFEGPMRIPLVAARLRGDGVAVDAALRSRAEADIELPRAPLETPLEVWFSFRSPYSYLAIEQLQRWRDRGDQLAIQLRPVLPMVMRGMAVPRAKKMYLVRDAAREARRLGIPFGRIADPVGDGARRCLAVCAAVVEDGDTGRAFDFAVAAARGIWSEGIDVATDPGLVLVAGRAGIGGDEVMAALNSIEAGAALAEANRAVLSDELGLWGVPSFRIGDTLVIWGQDRLDLVRHTLGLTAR